MSTIETASQQPGMVLEIGGGKGHFLAHLSGAARKYDRPIQILGIDIPDTVKALPGKALSGICAGGSARPFANDELNVVIYDCTLHHLINYLAAFPFSRIH